VAFGLFTFHASAGRMAFFAPTRAAAGWWTRPRVASADGTAGGCLDGGRQGLWDFLTTSEALGPAAPPAALPMPEPPREGADSELAALAEQQRAWLFRQGLVRSVTAAPAAAPRRPGAEGARRAGCFGHFQRASSRGSRAGSRAGSAGGSVNGANGDGGVLEHIGHLVRARQARPLPPPPAAPRRGCAGLSSDEDKMSEPHHWRFR